MTDVITVKALHKNYGNTVAVDQVDLGIPSGAIVGLIGPNGAGKTSLLRALLGLTTYDGEIEILGLSPAHNRIRLLEQVSFIADTATLPGWMKVAQLLDYADDVHPRFDRALAERLLTETEVKLGHRVRELSKGMTVQLHLALVMAIDARVLVLDEPTLGLDVLFRRRFFEQLLNDYYDGERTILISTHQVEEVEHILTHALFMNRGRVILNASIEDISERYFELQVAGPALATAEALPWMGQRKLLGGGAFIYRDLPREQLTALGEVRTPKLGDLFVASIEADRRAAA